MNIDRIAGAALACALGCAMLAGCASYGNLDGPYDPEAFGEANRQTYAAMVVDPEPEYNTELQGSAEKSADAIERYRNDAVKEPDSVSSTTTDPGGR